MKDVTITIPDNCELVQEGNTYVIKEKGTKPKSWEEFCKRYPTKNGEAYISTNGEVVLLYTDNSSRADKNWCISKEEAEAFLALMQLRQLRKAWVGDWEPSGDGYYAIVYDIKDELIVGSHEWLNKSLSFPTKEMADDFLNCFRDLCETAKCLL